MDTARSAPSEGSAEILAWPAEGDRRAGLISHGATRRLALEAGTLPPEAVDEMEDRMAPPDPGERPSTTVDGVTVLSWPAEAELRSERSRDHLPRVLVVTDHGPPPVVWDDLDEDGVRHGAGPAELVARSPGPAHRARRGATGPDGGAATARPVLDADGILRTIDGRWASIPPVEARLLAPLLDRPGHVVHRADLQRAAWPAGEVNGRALDGRIKLLRRRLAPLGIAIHTVRGLGYLLEVDRT